MNLAHHYALTFRGQSPAAARREWDGQCSEFCFRFADWLEVRGILYRLLWMERPGRPEVANILDFIHLEFQHYLYPGGNLNTPWDYHAALLVDGVVHDLWAEAPLPLAEYLAAMFPGQGVTVEAVGEGEPETVGGGLEAAA